MGWLDRRNAPGGGEAVQKVFEIVRAGIIDIAQAQKRFQRLFDRLLGVKSGGGMRVPGGRREDLERLTNALGQAQKASSLLTLRRHRVRALPGVPGAAWCL